MTTVYSSPIPAPAYDWSDFNMEAFDKAERDYEAALKAWLAANGYTGKNTGRIVSFGVADGHASYMVAEAGRKFSLIHMPLGDAYQYPDVKFLPKAEILRRADRNDKLAALFAKN
jgi:hypothetical protein